MSERPDGPPLTWYTTRPLDLPAPHEVRRAVRRQRALDALACLAIAALCFSQASRETLFRADRDFFNRLPLGPPTLEALILNLCLVTAAGVVCIQAIRRVARSSLRRVAAVAAVATVLVALNFVRMTYDWIAGSVDWLGRPGAIAVVLAALAVAFRWPRETLRGVRKGALFVAPLGVFTLVHASWMFLEVAAGPVWRSVEPVPMKTPAPSLRRVVWLVFAEMDQHTTFEARPAGLELPELDRFRRESLYADAAQPPAGTAEVSMPALITGRPVVSVLPLSPNDLELTLADGKKVKWSAHPNVFSRARVFGYDTAVVGWYLPYPRVLGPSLGAAEWRPSAAYEQARGDTVGTAFVNQWASLAPGVHLRRVSIRRFAEVGELALRAATDGRFGLVLLHLPLPQAPGIYDAARGHVTAWNFTGTEHEYLDNLALADRVVGELRRGLDRARLGDRTWVVVSSDRWWRASKRPDGQVDHRVPFLVRPPDGDRTMHVDGAFNTLGTHDLVLAILRGSVTDTTGAATWLTRYQSTPPKGYTPLGRPIY